MSDWTSCPGYHYALERPQGIAYIIDGEKITWRQLYRYVYLISEQLEQSTDKQQHIAAVANNSRDLLLLLMSCIHVGRVFFPINPAFPDSKIIQLCKDTSTSKLWCPDPSRLQDFSGERLEIDFTDQGDVDFSIVPRIPVDTAASLILTSGSSGFPKAVQHSLSNHIASAQGSMQRVPLQPGDGWLASLPLYHIGGYAITVRCMMAGATVIIDSQKTPLDQLLHSYPITHLSLVNTQLYRLLQNQPELPKRELKVLLGGGPVAAELLIQLKAYPQIEAFTSYGLTEMSSQVATGMAQPGISGQLLLGSQLKLADDGEILVRGDALSAGYWINGQLTSNVDEQGWFHTKDLGEMENGWLKILGRKDQMLISGGENIQPQQIEQQLLALPGVVQAVVVAVSDKQWGQRPVAFIEWSDPALQLDLQQIHAHLKLSLAGFMLPDAIFAWPEQMTSMKPNRSLLTSIAKEKHQLAAD